MTPADSGTPTGTVHFQQGGVDLGTGTLAVSGGNDQATFSLTSLNAGANSITAVYDGDSSYTGSTSSSYGQTVSQAATTTIVGASATMLAPDQAVTLSAYVSYAAANPYIPTGTVTFKDFGATLGGDSIILGTATLSMPGIANLPMPAGLTVGTHTMEMIYSGDGNSSTSYAKETLYVAPPANDPVQPTVNCGCPNSEGSVPQVNVRKYVPVPGDSDAYPVRYADGVLTYAETDVYAPASGVSLGTNQVVDEWLRLLQRHERRRLGQYLYATTANGRWLYVEYSGSGQRRHQRGILRPGRWRVPAAVRRPVAAELQQRQRSVHNDRWRGDQIVFSGFSTDRPTAQRGEFASYTDATGQTLSVTSYTTSGAIAEVQRTADGVIESFLYSYLPSTDPNAGLLSNVTLRRSVDDGETWSVVQQVNYAYYAGTENGGNLGDLMTATVEDGSENVLSSSYYRYYMAGEANGYQHGLEYVVNPASYARMTAALGTDLSSLTDAQVAQFADYYFQYDSQGRVTQEVVAGAGSSTDSGGQGTYTYSYTASSNSPGFNSWAMKTIVTAPDGSMDTVYTNAYGQVMLDDHYDPTSEVDTVSFYVYSSSGQLILSAAPSAVSGYDDGYADLLNKIDGSYTYLNDSSGLITIYTIIRIRRQRPRRPAT